MASILAIEPDFERAALLRTIADEQIRSPFTLVESIDAALDAIERRVPELILISPLLAPPDEGRLMARLRVLPRTAHVQTLITPELATPPEPKTWRYGRRRPVLPAACDPAAFVSQVNEYLALATEQRAAAPMFRGRDASDRRTAARFDCPRQPLALVNGSAAMVVDLSATGAQIVSSSVLVPGRLVDVVIEDGTRLVRGRASVVWGSFETMDDAELRYRAGIDFTDDVSIPCSLVSTRPRVAEVVEEQPSTALAVVRSQPAAERDRANRLPPADIPLLSTVKLAWGAEVNLLNLSRTGMLVETTSKFAPGTSTPIELWAADNPIVVPARFVRSEVVTVDGRGVRYRAAAMFEREIDLEMLGVTLPGANATQKEVADWLRKIAREISEGREGAVLRSLATVFAEYGRQAAAH